MVEDTPQKFGKGTGLVKLGLVVCGLAALIVPQFVLARKQGQLSDCKSQFKNIGVALEMYSTVWGGHYPRNLNQLIPKYLPRLPECPAAGRMTYRADFGRHAAGNTRHVEDYYILECAGENHVGLGVAPNYPAYDTDNGLRTESW